MITKEGIEIIINTLGNQKIKLLFWILNNLDHENKLMKTQKQIAEQTGVSYQTVNETLKILINNNILIKINNSAYKLNTKTKNNDQM